MITRPRVGEMRRNGLKLPVTSTQTTSSRCPLYDKDKPDDVFWLVERDNLGHTQGNTDSRNTSTSPCASKRRVGMLASYLSWAVGAKSRSAADSSLKQPVDSRGADPQGPDTQRSVMSTYLHSERLLVEPEYVGQSLDEAPRG